MIVVTACAGRAGPVESPALRAEHVRLAIAVAEGHVDRGDFAAGARVLDDALTLTGQDPGAQVALLAARATLVADRTFSDVASADDGRRLLEPAQAAVERAGDRAAQATVLDARGWLEYAVALLQDRNFDRSRPWFTRALALREALGDRGGMAETLFHLGLTYEQEGKDGEARPRYERALELATAAGDEVVMSYALRHLASYVARDGDPEKALDYHRRCLALRIKNGHVRHAAFALIAIGNGELEARREPVAAALYQQALVLAEAQGNRSAIMSTRMALATADERAGRTTEAVAHYRAASELAEALGNTAAAAEIRTALARLAPP